MSGKIGQNGPTGNIGNNGMNRNNVAQHRKIGKRVMHNITSIDIFQSCSANVTTLNIQMDTSGHGKEKPIDTGLTSRMSGGHHMYIKIMPMNHTFIGTAKKNGSSSVISNMLQQMLTWIAALLKAAAHQDKHIDVQYFSTTSSYA